MKTVRLFFLLCWALARLTPETTAQTFHCSAGTPAFAVLPARAPEEEAVEQTTAPLQTATRVYIRQVLDTSRQTTAAWRDFVDAWLANKEKMWIWMFLLLLLLARL
ncbi:MAG TPA: hypothetical protein PLW66_02855 [Saprospiraceae bacterium]|nr:hypothetical protein [Saprospiraceae bacterium]